MKSRTSINLRRLAIAIPMAAAATFSAGAFGHPATACAAPRESDVAIYDDCMADLLADYQTGKELQEYNGDAKTCCKTSGGVVSETQGCVAPTGEEAQEAERQPVPPASPDFGNSEATLDTAASRWPGSATPR